MKTLYHGTSSINLNCIKTIGIVPGHAKGGDAWATQHHMQLALLAEHRLPSVYLTDEVEDAEYFARIAVEEMGGDPIIVTVHVPVEVFTSYSADDLYETDSEGHTHAWMTHSVPVKYVAEVKPVKPETEEQQFTNMLRTLLLGNVLAA